MTLRKMLKRKSTRKSVIECDAEERGRQPRRRVKTPWPRGASPAHLAPRTITAAAFVVAVDLGAVGV